MAATDAHLPSVLTSPRSSRARVIQLAMWCVVLAGEIGVFLKSFRVGFDDQVDMVNLSAETAERLRSSLATIWLTPERFAIFSVSVDGLSKLVALAISAVLMWRSRGDWFIAWLALMILGTSQANFPPDIPRLMDHNQIWMTIARLITTLAISSLFVIPFIFPNGRVVPRWTAVPLAAWCLMAVAFIFAPDKELLPAPAGTILEIVSTPFFLLVGIYSQIYRYRRVSNRVEQLQTKWVVFGISIALPAFFVGDWIITRTPNGIGGAALSITFAVLMPFAFTLIPITIAIAVLRYRLYDIDLVISRTLLWVVMSAIVVASYTLVVIGIGSLIDARGSIGLSIFMTGLVAVAFAPVKARVQRGVNRLLFGDRDDPYAVLSRLGQRLETTLAPDEILPMIVQTLKDVLRLPYAAVYLGYPAGQLVAAAGSPDHGEVRMALSYQARHVGELVVSPRSPGEQFGRADRRLLEDLSRQVGVAAHAVTLTQDLQRSRERIVSAREEERRRLRRDLHDSLGAQLAALSIQAGALRSAIRASPEEAETQTDELRVELRAAIADIRRLVQGLRPPALDEIGLVAALRERSTRYGAGGVYREGEVDVTGNPGLRVEFDSPESLPPLPAAIEVALYRITEEALTNVVKHAAASTCVVSINIDRDIELRIEDDGCGIAAGRTHGVGLGSMRERAEELGGVFEAGPGPTGRGTLVSVRLPLPVEGLS